MFERSYSSLIIKFKMAEFASKCLEYYCLQTKAVKELRLKFSFFVKHSQMLDVSFAVFRTDFVQISFIDFRYFIQIPNQNYFYFDPILVRNLLTCFDFDFEAVIRRLTFKAVKLQRILKTFVIVVG